MSNLLPPKSKKTIRKEYVLRIATITFVFLTLAAVIGGVLLVPPLLFVQSQIGSATNQLAVIEESLSVRTEEGAITDVAAIRDKLNLVASRQRANLYVLIEDISEGKPDTVAITSFFFDRSSETEYKLTLAGIAQNRDDLVFFSNLLEGDSRISGVSLPISNLAASKDIRFSMTMTIRWDL